MVGKYNCRLMLANSKRNNKTRFKPIMTVDIWPAFQSRTDVSLMFALFMSVCNIAFICAGYVGKGREGKKPWPDKGERCQIGSVG